MIRGPLTGVLCVAGLFGVAPLLWAAGAGCGSPHEPAADSGSGPNGSQAGQTAPWMAGRGDTAGKASMPDVDAGGRCISSEGGPCGGNTRSPCACASELVCTGAAGSSLPIGDVGGTCQKAKGTSAACQSSADCQLQADYCTGCDCRALAHGQSAPVCDGPGVSCFVDPCAGKSAQCVAGKCVAP